MTKKQKRKSRSCYFGKMYVIICSRSGRGGSAKEEIRPIPSGGIDLYFGFGGMYQ